MCCSNKSSNLYPDEALLTAKTGLKNITSANVSLSGAGSVTVLTVGSNGTVIKSVTIKATQATTSGMIRLFVFDGTNYSLYKEVPVPTQPMLAATPTPAPVLPTFEVMLQGGLKLKSGWSISASTQNAESFNIIVEGVEWEYLSTPVPPDPALPCCNYLRETANTGIGTVDTANAELGGGGAIVDILDTTGSANGCTLKAITIKALQSTHPGMVRLFIGDGTDYFLYREIMVPETTQSSNNPSYKNVIESDFRLEKDLTISASTQIAESFSITAEGVDWTYA